MMQFVTCAVIYLTFHLTRQTLIYNDGGKMREEEEEERVTIRSDYRSALHR